MSQYGTSAIRAAFTDASIDVEDGPLLDPDPNLPRDGIKAGEWAGAPHDDMPPDCPVQVLGHDTDTTYVVSAAGQLHAVTRWDHTKLVQLFAPYTNYLYWAWPGKSKPVKNEDGEVVVPSKVVRVERDKAATCLITEAARVGLFDPTGNVRGRGGWKTKNGDFLWHSGEWLWSVDKEGTMKRSRPQGHEGMLYTRMPNVIIPWQTEILPHESPARALLMTLSTWTWERPFLDPVLVLGWIGSAFFGGALDERPHVFTTGGRGTGKSTMQRLIKEVFDRAVHNTADTTAAGIYQRVKQDSLPVMVDELENKAGSSRAQAVLELARLAYSGAEGYRGGADGQGSSFLMMNSFLFSAIIPPAMGAQDKSRMAVLNLEKLDKSRVLAQKPELHEDDGRMMLRQLMQGWHKLQTELLPDWERILASVDFDSRGINTYATLLATAELMAGKDMLAHVGLDLDNPEVLGAQISAATAMSRAEELEQWEMCLQELLDCPIDAFQGGKRQTVAEVLQEEISTPSIYHTRGLLAHAGIGLREKGKPLDGYALAVPTAASVRGLAKIFEQGDFAKGGWVSALKQAPKDIVRRDCGNQHTVKIGGTARHCLLVDLELFWKHMEGRWLEDD